jgi:two-component system sensor histidine kinase PilS (NtrC family)
MNSAPTDALEKQTGRGSRDALLQKAMAEPELGLRMLVTLNAFRLLIATSLLLLFVVDMDPRFFGDTKPTLFAAVAAAYLVFAILSAISLRQDYVPRTVLATTQLIADIVAITLFVHASGGISSGLGGLLVIFIGAGSLVLRGSVATTLAAMATLAILGEQAYTQVTDLSVSPNWPAAGVLGAIIFAIALAAQPLARRISASEALARQFGVDLKNLSELNDYIVQHLRESIVVVDNADAVRLINGSAAQLLAGGPIRRGTQLGAVCTPLADYIAAWRSDNDMSSHPSMTLITEGDNVRITAHLAPLGKGGRRDGPILVFLEDVSHINERVQQSKLASLGRLSASIAHEIRNPVGAMSHAAQLLAESPGMSNDDQRLTAIIQNHSERVSHIIDNVLQLSRRDSSRPERLQLAAWLEDFATEFVQTLELNEGEFAIRDMPADLEARIDRSHLRQVLWNLCDNAIKYASETGGIMIEVQGGRMPSQGRPYIEVLDCGHGIDAASADKIFEPFFTARSGGTGLGLYISRELCELNRATLLYLDRPGGGSIFRIVFSDPDRWDTQDEQ